MQNSEFVHLHVHSEYSLLDGACRIPRLVQRVKELGQTAVAVTDHGNMYAAVEFYKEAKRQGIRPIIGCEVYVAQRTRFDREASLDGKSYHLVLLCENNRGYQNLMKLVSLSNIEGFYKKPRLDLDMLRQYHEGLICLSACVAGEIPRCLLAGDYAGAKEAALRYDAIFGRGNFFLEIQDHGIREEHTVLPQLVRLARETGIPLAATNDVHYLTRQDAAVQKAMLCIQTGRTVNQPTGMGFDTDCFYLRSAEEMAALFPQYPDALSATAAIARRCCVELTFGEKRLPHFTERGVTDNRAHLHRLCREGLLRHYGENPDRAVTERLDYELRVIEDMGFVDYFLIVGDFIRYARSRGIPVGPGRGSAAGSLCAYCMDITEIDPIKENLLFERFLNPERVSMPDIDIDFCIEGRQQVKDYVVERYGSDHVCGIVCFDTLKARAAVRDIGRVLDLPYALCDRVARCIDGKQTIGEALAARKELRRMYEEDAQVHRLLDLAQRVEGMIRHTTIHPAGVVIAAQPVMEFVPLQMDEDMASSQYSMDILEELGLLKIDFLGLRNLTIIRDAVRSIRRYEPDFSIEEIPLDDSEVFSMLSRGNTAGVFQLESPGMKNFITAFKPACLDDIVACLALYRPGPMESIGDYLARRSGRKPAAYLHPLLEDILSSTCGCIVYQEQVMEICRKLAGYSYGRADSVRRIMKKKDREKMKKERQVFLYGSGRDDGCTGAVARGVSPETANQIFDQMESFAAYAFNKSHAVAYALTAYRTAYLKCRYFGDYMAALMTSVISETEKLQGYLEECRMAGLSICPPDVNTGGWSFTCRDGKMYYGLLAIRGLGKSLIDRMLLDRQQNGPFTSFVDFCRRMSALGMNRRTLEAVIQAGALDGLDCNRRQMMLHYERVMDAVGGSMGAVLDGQMSLFGEAESAASDLTIPPMEDFDLMARLRMEKQVTGMYLTGHPLDSVLYLRDLLHCSSACDLTLEKAVDRQPVRLLAIVRSFKKHRTKDGKEMCFMTLEESGTAVEAVVFPQLYGTCAAHIREDAVVYITGRISVREERVSVLCDSLQPQEDLPAMLRRMQLCVKIARSEDLHAVELLQCLSQQHPGETEVILYFTAGSRAGKYVRPRQRIAVEVNESLYRAVCGEIPPGSVGCIPRMQ